MGFRLVIFAVAPALIESLELERELRAVGLHV